MVLQTSGYYVTPYPVMSEPTELLGANQVSVEQRYFPPSRPRPARWKHLTIRQAAADHHRIVSALEPICGQRWISTGASKGGMTSVYHRRFYTDDVDGTVVYVAPNDVRDRDDRYQAFIDRAGHDRTRRGVVRRHGARDPLRVLDVRRQLPVRLHPGATFHRPPHLRLHRPYRRLDLQHRPGATAVPGVLLPGCPRTRGTVDGC